MIELWLSLQASGTVHSLFIFSPLTFPSFPLPSSLSLSLSLSFSFSSSFSLSLSLFSLCSLSSSLSLPPPSPSPSSSLSLLPSSHPSLSLSLSSHPLPRVTSEAGSLGDRRGRSPRYPPGHRTFRMAAISAHSSVTAQRTRTGERDASPWQRLHAIATAALVWKRDLGRQRRERGR